MTSPSPRDAAVFAKNRTVVVGDGASIAYSLLPEGDRIPILYLNGWSCPDCYWSGVVPGLLRLGHPAVVPDVRGSGRSRLPRDPGCAGRRIRREDVTVERLARDVIEVLDDVGLGQAVLMGHSMGVQILFEAYRQAPERVRALVPIAGMYENPVRTFAGLEGLDRIYPWADVVLRRFPFEWIQPLLTRLATPEAAYRFARAIGLGGSRLRPDDLVPHTIQIQRVHLSVLWRIMAEMRLHSAADVLPRIRVPVLIFAGGADYFTPPRIQKAMHERIPESEIVWFDEGTHLLPLDEADEIVRRTEDFLARRLPAVESGG